MTRRAFWTAFAVAAGIAGCDPAKELPDEIPKHAGPQFTAPVVPDKSQPEAQEYVKQVLGAYTGAKPELVGKGKFSRLVLKGKMVPPMLPDSPPVDGTRTVAAVWPDRYAGTDEMRVQDDTIRISAYLHRPRLAVLNGGQPLRLDNPAETEHLLAADATGQHWVPLMLPLVNPDAVVFGLRNQTGRGADGQPAEFRTLLLHLEGLPLYQLTFDPVTHNLVQVDYDLTESGLLVRRTWQLAGHLRGTEGLVLPGRMAGSRNGKQVEEWAEAKWEFPAKIDDAEFAPPKN